MCSYSKKLCSFLARLSSEQDEQTEMPTPKNLPQYVADQVGFDIIYRKRRFATPAFGRLTARAIEYYLGQILQYLTF